MWVIFQMEAGIALSKEQLAILADTGDIVDSLLGAYSLTTNPIFQSDGFDLYDSCCDEVPTAQASFVANLSSYGSNVFFEVPHSETYQNDMDNQSVQVMPYFEQTPVDAYPYNKITSDSNIIPYSQYLLETQQAAIQDTNSSTQQDSMILSVIEQMSEQMINHVTKWDKANKEANNRLALKQQIDSLEQNNSNQIKEKESLLQTFTVSKNESKEKESKYMDKEIDLEKKIKELDNIVYKVGQSAQTVHMQHEVIPVTDEEETLILEEILENVLFHKCNCLRNKLSGNDTQTSAGVEVPKELPKVSLVNTSVKRLKNHLASFDKVTKVRTTPDAITEGSWGFEHTKKVFNEEVFPFKNSLQTLVKDFENGLFNELNEVKTVFNQMEAAVDQCFVNKKLFEIEKKELKLDNERLLEHIICQDVVNIVMNADVKSVNVLPVQNTFLDDNIALDVLKMKNDRLMELLVSQDLVHTVVNSLAVINDYQSMERSYIEEYERNLKLAGELSQMNELSKTCSRLEQRCISLELKLQHNKESFQNDKPCKNQDAPEFGKSVSDCSESVNKPKVIAPSVLKLDLEPLSSKLRNNREAHVDYIRINKENTDTLRDIEQARTSNPLDSALAYACMYTKQIQELLVYVRDTCPSSPSRSEKLVAVTPMNKARKVTFEKTNATLENTTQKRVDVHKTHTTNKPLVPSTNVKCSNYDSRSKPQSETKNTRILQTLSSNQKYQRVEAHTRNAKPSLNKEKRPGLQPMTPGYISLGLVQNPVSSTPCVPPSKKDYEIMFQPLFDEYFNPPPGVVSPDPVAVAAPRAIDPARSPSSTTIDQDVPSASTSPTNQEIQSQVIHQGVEEQIHGNQKNHPLENVIGGPSRPVSTRNQLQEHAIWCYFNANDNPIPFGRKRSG
ncbi:hypothetical protein Tco_0355127 [Tanacetum coccineum]